MGIEVNHFLAHQIKISDILSWERKSYLTNFILPRLSSEGCTLAVLELTQMVVKRRHCYVKVTLSCHDVSKPIQDFL